MKNFLLVIALLLILNGCKSLGTFTHQLGPEDAHSLIEVIAPVKTLREMEQEHRELGISATIVEVDAIDGIPVAYKPGKNQSFRMIPGKHEIKYKMTSIGYFPIDNPASKVVASGFFALGGYGIPEKVYGHKHNYVSKQLNTVAGKHYRLIGFNIDVSEINEMESPQ